ncbi:ComEC/Rec2 family competence protein [Lacticaseibacillus porcinae]|uniref:ComEC/Rec2 family competence protein n=1 Tax=Lacticaseibacillus porcinae TaxID=1123687 RepID=UPI000F78C8DA|nr:ComEC/Rec2 family competence protein [Lacticaseibacillus porcinae]
MNGRLWPLSAALLAGILLFVGPMWVSIMLMGWSLFKTWKLVKWWLLVAFAGGALIGYHEYHLSQTPPLPQGQILVMPTSWTITGTFVRYSGIAANGVVTSGSANVSAPVAEQLGQLTTPVIVTVKQPPEKITGARNEYEFDYAYYAWVQTHQAFQQPTEPLVWQTRPAQTLSEWLYGLRASLQRRIAAMPPHVSRYALGLLLGQVNGDADGMRQTFIALGIFHLFSVSGLHLFALIGALYWLSDHLRIPKEAIDWALIFSLPALLILIPPGAGILRAVWMRVGLSLNSRLHLNLSTFDIFSLVLAGNLLWRPLVLHTFGGQLTYLLTGVLMLLPEMPPWQLAWRLVGASLPVVVAQTYRIHLLSGWFNWLLMPVFELAVMPLLLVVVIFPHTGLTNGLEWALTQGEAGLTGLANLPGLVVFGAVPSTFAIIGVIIFLISTVQHRIRYFILWLGVAYGVAQWHPQTRVIVFDVGQGDAILIEGANKSGTMLVDTGGRIFGTSTNPPALRVIVNYLYARGYSHLDTLVLTHADADHVGDAAVLTKQLPVTTMISTPLAIDQSVIQNAAKGQVKQWHTVLAGDTVRAGAIAMQVVAPKSTDATEKNADSIVLYGKIDNSNWLLTADADAGVESRELIPQHLAVDYLKVGHHGSSTSSSPAFIDQWQLKAALISAGVNNRYGHPTPQTITTLEAAGDPWYNTATSGMLWVEDDHLHQFLKE